MMLTDHKNKLMPKGSIRSRIFLPTVTSLLLGTQFGCSDVDTKKFLHKNNLKQQIQSAPSLSPKPTRGEAKRFDAVESPKGGGGHGGGAGGGGGGYSSSDNGDTSGSSAAIPNVKAAPSMVETVLTHRPQIPTSQPAPLEGEGGNHTEKNATDTTFVSTPPSIGAEGGKVLVKDTHNTTYLPGAESSPDHSTDQSTMPNTTSESVSLCDRLQAQGLKLRKSVSFNKEKPTPTILEVGIRKRGSAVNGSSSESSESEDE